MRLLFILLLLLVSLPINAGLTVDPVPAGVSSSSNQINGNQKTQIVQGSNTLGIDSNGRIGINYIPPVTVISATASTAMITSVIISSSISTTLLNPNSVRVGAIFFNQGAGLCYVNYGGTASPTLFSYQLLNNIAYIMDSPIFLGSITIYCTGNGNILVTEET